MRVVDESVAPGRHLDPAAVVDRRVASGFVVVPETQGARLFQIDPFGARDFLQRLHQPVGPVDIERQGLPGRVAGPQFGQRQAVEPRRDRQQPQAGRAAGLPCQLDRAHGRASRRGGQHPAPGIGEEDGVDQLRLAARKLGHEGDDELFMRQPFTHRSQPGGVCSVEPLVLGEGALQPLQPRQHGVAPLAQRVQAGGESRSHANMLAEGSGGKPAQNIWSPARRDKVPGRPGGASSQLQRSFRGWEAFAARSTGRASDRVACAAQFHRRFASSTQRRWQPGQKNVARCPCTMRLTLPPQRTQASPARP